MYKPEFRKKNNGVPILSKSELEDMAENFIRDFNPDALKTPMEIDIDSFAQNYLRLNQDFQYLSHNGMYLGMIVFNDSDIPVYIPQINRAEYIKAKAGTIIIDNNLLAESQEQRYRYTMGHECGHDIFHKSYFAFDPNQITMFVGKQKPMIQCREISLNSKAKPVDQWTDKDRMEWQANYFSSALLMPKSMVSKLIESVTNKNTLSIHAKRVYEMIRTFNVSAQAAEYRLRELGFIFTREGKPPASDFVNGKIKIHRLSERPGCKQS